MPETIGLGPERRLAPCPDSPNCLSSQAEDVDHRVEPLAIRVDADRAWELAVRAVSEAERASIVEHRPGDGYLHATFRSAVFRFVDDLELLLDRHAKVIHLRSASRLGYYDFGANGRRIGALRERFRALQADAAGGADGPSP